MLHIYFQSKLIILILLFTSICNVQCAQHPAIHFEIETDQPCQTMDYFGASDCWSMQFIGLWPQEKHDIRIGQMLSMDYLTWCWDMVSSFYCPALSE